MYQPASNRKLLLYVEQIVSISLLVNRRLVSIRLNISCTVCRLRLFIDLYQDVDPVPVLTHKPELLTFWYVCSLSNFMNKELVRADNVSPMNT